MNFDTGDVTDDLFANQFSFGSVKQENVVMQQNLENIDFDFSEFSNLHSNDAMVHQASQQMASTPTIPVPTKVPKHSILLQQLQEETKPAVDSSELILKRLLQQAQASRGPSEMNPTLDILQPEPPKINFINSAATLQLLTKAGIQQPAKRQIQLHSELARHLTARVSPIQLGQQQQQQVQQQQQQGIPKVQIRLASKADMPTADARMEGQRRVQKIILQPVQQQQPKQPMPPAQTVILPQQIIVNPRPQQQQPQPQQTTSSISLEQLQQVMNWNWL